MTRQMTATELKAKLLAVLDEVSNGEDVEITKHGRTIARLSPARGPAALKDKFAGRVWTVDPKDDLLSVDAEWDFDERNIVGHSRPGVVDD